MSAILKALRRLEREKAEERPSDLDRRVAAPEAAPRSGPGWLRRIALLVFGALLGVGGGALLTWFSLPRGDEGSPNGVAVLEPVAAAPAFEGPEPEPRQLAMANPDRVPAPPAEPRVSEALRSSSSPARRTLPEELLQVPAQPSQTAPEPAARDLPTVAVLWREARPESGSATAAATEPPAGGAGEVEQEPEMASVAQRIQSSQVEKAVLAERAGREAAPVIVRKSLPELIVKRTVWHPDSKRRVAVIQVVGHSGLLDLREGDSIEGLTIVEITPSGVNFDHGGVELYKRLGAGG
jgi:hypothetical protein